MHLERLLQINLATTAVLSSLLFGMGERSLAAPLMLGAATTLSVWLTDIKGVFRLNRSLAGLGALVALVLAFWRTRGLSGEMLLWNIAHLLVVLQIIMFFQKKDDRTYGQLAMLSLLLAMVATLFNQSMVFGVLLVIYALAGLSSMVLLFLVKQHREFLATDSEADGRGASSSFAAARFRPSLAGPPRSAIQFDLIRCLCSMAVFTLFFSALVFSATPRIGYGAWRGAGGKMRSLVGFSDTVILGEMGDMLENSEVVLQLALLDATTRETRRVEPQVYLRGAVLSRYDRGRWWTWTSGWGDMNPAPPLPSSFLFEPKVIQRIVIEPLDRSELFCVWPFSLLEETSDITFDPRTQRLLRNEEARGYRFEYELGTSAFDQGRQSVWAPCNDLSPDGRAERRLLHHPPLPRLKALAEQWIAETDLRDDDRAGRARLLESRLRDSGLFSYSLQGQQRNPQLDPIEDFVSEHRVGHCEYFATALAMMLRSQGIPCRVVVGYCSDEWNEFGKRFVVRQLHAHSWVEARIPPEQLPPELIRGPDHWQWANGAWLRLDPTPAAAEAASSADGFWARWNRWQDWWSSYVLDMDRRQQYESIYEPVRTAVERWWSALTDLDQWKARVLRAIEAFRAATWPARIASAAVFVLVTVGLIWLVAGLWKRWAGRRRFRPYGSAGAVRTSAVAFFARCERTLRKARCLRSSAQTQREFAAGAAEELIRRGAAAEVGPHLSLIAEAFYRVRFGRRPLDAAELHAVELALAAVEAEVHAVKRVRRGSPPAVSA